MGYRKWFVDKVEGTKIYLNQRLRQVITQFNELILCKVRAISKSDKHHIHLDMYLGQIGYRILDLVPSSVNRALKGLEQKPHLTVVLPSLG